MVFNNDLTTMSDHSSVISRPSECKFGICLFDISGVVNLCTTFLCHYLPNFFSAAFKGSYNRAIHFLLSGGLQGRWHFHLTAKLEQFFLKNRCGVLCLYIKLPKNRCSHGILVCHSYALSLLHLHILVLLANIEGGLVVWIDYSRSPLRPLKLL